MIKKISLFLTVVLYTFLCSLDNRWLSDFLMSGVLTREVSLHSNLSWLLILFSYVYDRLQIVCLHVIRYILTTRHVGTQLGSSTMQAHSSCVDKAP